MSEQTPLQPLPAYERIYAVVKTIPAGRVATYGQVASIVGNCTARMVGYALAVVPPGSDVPWQRVINAQGKISLRADSDGHERQRQLLVEEGIRFDGEGKIDLRRYRWSGPQLDWLLEQGYDPEPSWQED
ncbi:MAG TPA: MGMT family protein [Caldilineaceae bacterium]|nr:MGMT family protein [Caldilineaceae bacterium]